MTKPIEERLRQLASKNHPAVIGDLWNALDEAADEIERLRQREAGMRAQHDRDSAELRRLCAGRDNAKHKITHLRALLREKVPAILFDGHAVYQGVKAAGRDGRTSPENVSDVLDAVVRALRREES